MGTKTGRSGYLRKAWKVVLLVTLLSLMLQFNVFAKEDTLGTAEEAVGEDAPEGEMSETTYAEGDDTVDDEGEGGQGEGGEGGREEGGEGDREEGGEEDPEPVMTGLHKIDGEWYYFDENGKKLTGWQTIDGKKYYFRKAGMAAVGWLEKEGHWYFFSKKGVMRTGWVENASNWYFFDKKGRMYSGWKKEDGYRYYLAPNGIMQLGWRQIDGKWYYFGTTGRMATGWRMIDKCWYFFDTTGVMKTGWLESGKDWYYLDVNGKMKTGWLESGKKWYYFDVNGKMKTGWQKVGASWYYLDAEGRMKTGWMNSGQNRYYLRSDGRMATGWFKPDNYWYYFNEDGELQRNCRIDGYYLNSEGRWVDQLPDAFRLDVDNIMQRPELPMGCEVTSLTIVLNYHGYDVKKGYLSDNFLKKGASSPDAGFIGNPRSWGGWYCYSKPIVNCANDYLKSVGSESRARNLTGTKFEDLFYELVVGRPVVIWGTLSMGSPSTRGRWSNGYPRYVNLHCLVLTGYDKTKDLVYIADPLAGNRTYRLSTTKLRYEQLGSQAVVICDPE